MTETMLMRPRKSEKLSKQELADLKKYRKAFDTEVACAISIGIDRLVLNRVLLKGSGSPETIEKIKAVLSKDENNV